MVDRHVTYGLTFIALILALIVGTVASYEGVFRSTVPLTVSSDRAITVTRNVLVRQGYDVVRVERVGATQVVYYRAGNRGRGKGKGPVQKMVIRTVERRIVFEETPPAIMVDIDVNLKL